MVSGDLEVRTCMAAWKYADQVEELICYQEHDPGLHFLVDKIAWHSGASKLFAHCMAKNCDLN